MGLIQLELALLTQKKQPLWRECFFYRACSFLRLTLPHLRPNQTNLSAAELFGREWIFYGTSPNRACTPHSEKAALVAGMICLWDLFLLRLTLPHLRPNQTNGFQE